MAPQNLWDRRSALKVMACASAAATIGGSGPADAQTQQVPWSAGTESASLKVPRDATDGHHHIYDSRFPVDASVKLKPGDATVADYRLLQKRLGTTRNVVIQPSTYGVDNSCLLDALARFDPDRTRGVAVVDTGVTDGELRRLHDAGVRGIRFNLSYPGSTTPDMMEPLAKRVQEFGWHVQIVATADEILRLHDVLNRIPTPIVFDHFGHVPEPEGMKHPAYALITALMRAGRGWVKLSGVYIDSKLGPPTYADRTAIARAFVEVAPEHIVWGSDWPHPTLKDKPDDATLLDLLAEWAPDAATRQRILVDNPSKLYGFG